MADKILILDSLLIGYRTGMMTNSLLPALTSGVRKGETVAIIGQNGIGKSTLLRTVTGLQRELGGKVIINGRNLKEYSRYELARNIGYISTEPVRVSSMTVTDLVRLGRYPHTGWTGRFSGEDHRLVAEAICLAGINALSERYINELSDGERQRAMIARALAQDADILFMDEPTAFLDIRSRYEIIHLLHDLSRRRGKTIIYSTHDMLTAMGESDRIWLLFSDSFMEGAPEDMVLSGSFERLFEESVVKFNVSDGTFSFSREVAGNVRIDGSGTGRYWTERAVGRAGFGVTEMNSEIEIEVTSDNDNIRWSAIYGNNISEFDTLYDLVGWLGNVATRK